MISFRTLAMILAAFCIALGGLWFVDAVFYAQTYGVDMGDGGAFFGRRVSPILMGLGVMLNLARDAEPSPLRRAICVGVALAFGGVGCTGLLAYWDGTASFAILVAAGTEFFAAAAIMSVAQSR